MESKDFKDFAPFITIDAEGMNFEREREPSDPLLEASLLLERPCPQGQGTASASSSSSSDLPHWPQTIHNDPVLPPIPFTLPHPQPQPKQAAPGQFLLPFTIAPANIRNKCPYCGRGDEEAAVTSMSLSRVEPFLRPKIRGYRAWNALVTLWTRAEEQWVKWGSRPITLQDILSLKGGHHLVYTELDPAPVCDWCSINYAVYACPTDLLQIECLEQRFACEGCHEMGFNFHKGILGEGDPEYLISSISSAFRKADESHIGALSFLEALNCLWLLLEGMSDSHVAYLKAHGFGVEALKLLRDFYDDNATEESGLRVSDLRRLFKEVFRISPVNLGAVYDIHVPPGQLAKFRHVLWITYSVARPGSVFIKQWTRNEKMLLKMSTMEIRQEASYDEAEDLETPLCNVPTFLKSRCAILKMLGEGGCNVVWLVEYEGVRMAAKVPKASISTDAKDQMFAAARTQALIQHRNVLRVLGVHQEAAWPCILLELAEGGDLSDWHVANRIDRRVQWNALTEVAQGMAALHSINPPVIHRDLKGQNVFLTRYGKAKVADFDFAVRATPPHNTARGSCGTPGYIAPEVLSNKEYGVEVDVYSFGSLAYEVTHRAFPFAMETEHRSPEQWYEQAARLTLEGSRPAMNEEAVCPKMIQLIRDCWEHDPSARPSMAEVHARLQDLEEEFLVW